MSIYTVSKSVGASSLEFIERGLSGYQPGRISESCISGYNNAIPRLNYTMAVNNVHLSLKALKTGKSQILSTEFDSLLSLVPVLENFPRPILTMTAPPRNEGAEELLVAAGMVYDASRKSYKGRPSWEEFKTLLSIDQKSTRLSFGELTVQGYLAYFMLLKGIVAIRYITEAKEDSTSILCSGEGPISTLVGVTTAPMQVPTQDATNVLEGSTDVAYLEAHPNSSVFTFTNARIIIAPPNDFVPSVADMGIENARDHTGHVFPYFDGMLLPDNDTISFTFFRLFSRCLSASVGTTCAILEDLQKGIKNISRTTLGMTLSHIYFGIQLALDSEAKFDIIMEGNNYRGFYLAGSHVSLIVRGQKTDPLDVGELNSALDHLNVHNRALVKILDILKEFGGDSASHLTVKKISSSGALVKICDQLIVSNMGDDMKERFNILLEKLQFGEKYADISRDNIERALQSIHDNTDAFGVLPCVYFGGHIYKKSLTHRVLSHFGTKAPSFFNGTTTIFKVAKSGKVDPNLSKVNNVRPLHYLAIVKKPLLKAVEDWETMFNHAQIRMTINKGWTVEKKAQAWVSPKNCDFRVDDVAFDSCYELIRKICDARRQENPELEAGKGKRKATDTMETEAKKPRYTAGDL